MNRDQIYYIEWWDAHAASEWHSKQEVEEFIKTERCIVQEVGWILNETEDEIVMAYRKVKWSEDDRIAAEWGGLQKIPKAWIRKKCIFNLNNKGVKMGKSKAHPGFKAVAKKIAKKEGISEKKASAILAESSRNASAKAKRKNKNLRKVKN